MRLGGIVWNRKQWIWVASTLSRAGLIKSEKNKDGVFYGFCMVRKALGLMEMGDGTP